jgi:diacylglycerol kinase
MKNKGFSISKRLKSFVFAYSGLKVLFKEEHNSIIHLIVSILVIIASIYFELNTYEWIAVIFSIGLVFTAEIMNTAIENIADFLTTEKNDKIKIIKDLSAAAVLVSTITAVTIGAMIFLPKFMALYSKGTSIQPLL